MAVDYELIRNKLKKAGFDFDKMTDGLGKPIDEKIKPLLYVLNYCGFKTNQSCEGHPLEELKIKAIGKIIEEDAYHFVQETMYKRKPELKQFSSAPWVNFNANQDLSRLEYMIGEYNINAHIMWTFLKGRKVVWISPDYAHPIEELHANIKDIAEFMYGKLFDQAKAGLVR